MKSFRKYFYKVLTIGRHTKWRLFDRDAGQANTQSAIERHNLTIKVEFTDREVVHMLPFLETMEKMINVFSVNYKFDTDVVVIPLVYNLAKGLMVDAYERFENNPDIYAYNSALQNCTYTVNILRKTCTCLYYSKKAICKHLVGAYLMNGIKINGIRTEQFRAFRPRARKGPKCKLNLDTSMERHVVHKQPVVNSIGQLILQSHLGRSAKAGPALVRDALDLNMSTSDSNPGSSDDELNTSVNDICVPIDTGVAVAVVPLIDESDFVVYPIVTVKQPCLTKSKKLVVPREILVATRKSSRM